VLTKKSELNHNDKDVFPQAGMSELSAVLPLCYEQKPQNLP